MKIIKYLSIILFVFGSYLLLKPIYFYSKGIICQYILSNPFNETNSWDEYIKNKVRTNILDVNPIGEIIIPSVNIHQTILEGADGRTLMYGPGKIVSSYDIYDIQANIILSGHRDTFFRRLEYIKENDIIIIKHAKGKSLYKVYDIKQNVDPKSPHNIKLLDEEISETLTLVTCYPFEYIGPAPTRYLVLAKLIT